jgi:hypothetical protein
MRICAYRKEGTWWTKLYYNKELHDLYSTPNIIRTKWGEKGNITGRDHLVNLREDIIKTYVKETGWKRVDWIQVAPDRTQWLPLVNTVMNLRVPWKAGNFLTGWTIAAVRCCLQSSALRHCFLLIRTRKQAISSQTRIVSLCVTPRGCINEALSYTHSYAHAIVCNRDLKLGATGSRRTNTISPFSLELNQVLSHLKVKLF